MNHYFVLQAQTIGLWGEAFAAACVVVNEDMQMKEAHYLSCLSEAANGLAEDREWVEKTVLRHLPKNTECRDPHDLSERVWQIWIRCKQQYPHLYCSSYIGFPIAMNLLARAITHKIEEREDQAPYPLLEIDTAFLLTNYAISPRTHPRFDQEEPAYNPLCDAKYYARLFMLARKRIQEVGVSFEALSKKPLCGLDSKSRGLWGGIFLFGSILYNKENNEEKGTWRAWRIPGKVEGLPKDDVWRQPYLDILPKGDDCQNPAELGDEVWKWLKLAQKANALFISWCPFSVDYRAIGEAIKVNLKNRQLKAIYPIHDAATALFLTGKDPVGTYPRFEGEEKHGDPRGSARLAIRLFLSCAQSKIPTNLNAE